MAYMNKKNFTKKNHLNVSKSEEGEEYYKEKAKKKTVCVIDV